MAFRSAISILHDCRILSRKFHPILKDNTGNRLLYTTSVMWNDKNTHYDPAYEKIDLSFCNTEDAFRAKTNLELLRGYLVFQLCSINYIVDNNKEAMINNSIIKA